MKRSANECYYIGTFHNNGIDQGYYWNNLTKNLQRWNTDREGKETFEDRVLFSQLPEVFKPMFKGQDIILEETPQKPAPGSYL